MAKPTTRYICSACSHIEAKWIGRCPECRSYNTMEEAPASLSDKSQVKGFGSPAGPRTTARLSPSGLDTRAAPPPRVSTGHPELDRVLGGGLVEASAVLIGGSPGVGKSTLLLQMAAHLSRGQKVVYVTGEESLDQVQLRARRIGVESSPVDLIPSNDCLAIADYIETLPRGAIAIIDSLQTLHSGGESAPGSVTQVKLATAHLIPAAKAAGVTLVLVSHVTKEGSLAGPNVVVHAVDATLYVETDLAAGIYRLVRSEKNRFGAVDEVGVFEMTERGMLDVENPSEIFIAQRDSSAFGSTIFPSLEGSRPVLLEIQALVAPTAFGTGRRSANGWDTSRLNMLLATISARLGLQLIDSDIYVNVAGGMKVNDPAMDLAVAAAILSSYAQEPLPTSLAVFGEVGLAGEIRNSARAEARIKECIHLGLTQILCPQMRDSAHIPSEATLCPIRRLSEIFTLLPGMTSTYAGTKAAE